jgi:hypothetical protein
MALLNKDDAQTIGGVESEVDDEDDEVEAVGEWDIIKL